MVLWVNLLAVALIGFIVWWFWLFKPISRRVGAAEPLTIVVDNGVYTPSQIVAPVGKTVKLQFIRRDASPCAEKVIFVDLDVSAELPLNQKKEIQLIPRHKGKFEFTCQMGMYRGVLVVE